MPTTDGSTDRYALASQEDRSAPRTRMTIPASLRPAGSKGFQTVVHDLSLSGFAAVALNRLHPGTLCWLTMPGLETMEAQVIWWNDSMVGCAFRHLLSPIAYDTILDRAQGGSRGYRT